MAKIKNEDLRLNIIINGDARHIEILSLQQSMKDAKLSIKTTEAAIRDHKKADKSGHHGRTGPSRLRKGGRPYQHLTE